MNKFKKTAAFTIILCTLLSSMAGCNNIKNIDSETTSSGKITVNDTTNNNEIGVKNELTVENEILFTDDTTTKEEIISENAEDSTVDNNENIKKEYSKKYTNVEIEYEPILDAYMDMAVKAENFGKEAITANDYISLSDNIFEWMYTLANESSFGKGYAVKDLNNDGINELLFLDGRQPNYGIYSIFTIIDGTPVLLDSFNISNGAESVAISKEGTVYNSVTLKGESYINQIFKLSDNNVWFCDFSYSYHDYTAYDETLEVKRYKYVNGEKIEITAEELAEIEKEYSCYFNYENFNELTKQSGLSINYFFTFDPK